MSMPDFPVLSANERAQVAATLAAGACALAAGKEGMSHERAVQTAQRLFQRQLQFLQGRKWPEPEIEKKLSAGMNLA